MVALNRCGYIDNGCFCDLRRVRTGHPIALQDSVGSRFNFSGLVKELIFPALAEVRRSEIAAVVDCNDRASHRNILLTRHIFNSGLIVPMPVGFIRNTFVVSSAA